MNAYALEADMYDQWLSVKGIAEYKTLEGQLGFRPYVGGEHLIGKIFLTTQKRR